jgi:hypothetical protein
MLNAFRGTDDYESSRSLAVQFAERNGWSWPTVLDDEFPPVTEGGLKYERVTIEYVISITLGTITYNAYHSGHAYLRLTNPSEAPTLFQIHALKVLTYTFPLLSIIFPNLAVSPPLSQPIPMPQNVNILLQQVGTPQLRVANQNPNQNPLIPDLPEVAIRPLLATLLMLGFRTLLLLYFVAPARKPVFGILIFIWIIYEVWQPIRNFILRGWRQAVAEDLARQNGPARPIPNAWNAPQGPQRPPAVGQRGIAVNRIDAQAAALLDNLANVNIHTEEQSMAPVAGTVPEEPSLAHKMMTFVSLLAMTVHPAIWNRRRAALRQREGRVRAEANAREPQTEGEDAAQNEHRVQIRRELAEQHARRPQWVRDYVARVVAGDWADDSD